MGDNGVDDIKNKTITIDSDKPVYQVSRGSGGVINKRRSSRSW